MDSPGHRRNLLNPYHRQVNIGIGMDRYNIKMVQHLEGDYVEYDSLPIVRDGVLSLSGHAVNGATLGGQRGLQVQIYYDPPPVPLTAGQVARTYCYDSGLPVACLREKAPPGQFWPSSQFTTTYSACTDPAKVPLHAQPALSSDDAHRLWEQAYSRYKTRSVQSITVPWVTAFQYAVRVNAFTVQADISAILDRHGAGAYCLLLAKSLKRSHETWPSTNNGIPSILR